MGKLVFVFLLTVSARGKQILKDEFVFMDNLQLNNIHGVLSSSHVDCSARCNLLREDCCLFNYDKDTGKCVWSSDCAEVRTSTGGRTFIRKSSGAKLLLRDCSDLPQGFGSGIYRITPLYNSGNEMEVYCEVDPGGDRWTVIQRRVNAATSFYRNWNDYKNGFGDLEENFWLGNENIHDIVGQKAYKIRFNLEDKDGDTAYAEYSFFFVANEAANYKIMISGYSGNAGDGMTIGENAIYHNLNGMPFSTPDRDNDKHPGYDCARELNKAGWWINACTKVNLNGIYNSTDTSAGAADPIYWWNWRGHEGLKRVEISIK